MSKKEFIRSQEELNRAVNKRMGIWLVLFVVGMLCMIPLLNYIEAHSEEFRWIARASGGVFVGLIIVGFAFMAWDGIKQQRRGPKCPHCGKLLFGLNAKIAVATGNCGDCGETVFADSP